ncbi:helix-turn-helix transcriptional regulator [Actinomadura madurae]|uniref:helix-turn-helix transcriptional regulator n=1 Tax=Actinomadura madurae TaxID=1993 RepID=UPI0020D24273|nr:helix-turn-helix transcriptional regulator [Actinomadura madurae]
MAAADAASRGGRKAFRSSAEDVRGTRRAGLGRTGESGTVRDRCAHRGAAGKGRRARRLTHQELQIVRLAAAGASNREIAARLFLSPRTVGNHLYRAYPKLGVRTRVELRRLDLGAAAGTGVPGRRLSNPGGPVE